MDASNVILRALIFVLVAPLAAETFTVSALNLISADRVFDSASCAERRSEIAEAACAETADSSFEVTLVAPAITALIRLDNASTTDCRPSVETPPTLKHETRLNREDSAEIADAACAETAESSSEVTDPDPPVTAEIRLLSALIIDWRPWVDAPPTERADADARITDTALTRLDSALSAEIRLLISLNSATETIEAAFEAAFATDRAFEAAVETIDAAFEAAFATDKAFEAAVDTMLTAFDTTLIACDVAEIRFES